jgi:hypothetical protein
MTNLSPVHCLEIQILVDNATDSPRRVPKRVKTEFACLHRKMRILSGKCLCCAGHRLSYLIPFIAVPRVTQSCSTPSRKAEVQNISANGLPIWPYLNRRLKAGAPSIDWAGELQLRFSISVQRGALGGRNPSSSCRGRCSSAYGAYRRIDKTEQQIGN